MANPKFDMRGSAWKNEARRTENDPHWRGSMQVNGIDHWLSVWYNAPDGNSPELSMRITPKEEQRAAPAAYVQAGIAPQAAHPQIGVAQAPQAAPSPYANVPHASQFGQAPAPQMPTAADFGSDAPF